VIKSRKIRFAVPTARMGEIRCTYRDYVGKTEGNGPLRRPRLIGQDDIKMHLQEIGWFSIGASGGLLWTR
jgi:hypothetical protein